MMNILLRKTLLATIIFIFSIVGNTAATSITVTTTGNLDRSLTRFLDIVAYGDGLITLGGNPTIPLHDDSDNEFINWVDDLSGIMTSEMWELPIEVTCIGNLNSFNVSGPNNIFRKPRTIPDLFPLLHDDTFIRPAVVPDPIPEPGTVILFVMGLSGLGSYGWWRRRKINSLQMSVEKE